MAEKPNYLRLFDIPFYADSCSAILEKILNLPSKKEASSVIFANAHVVIESEWSQNLKKNLNKATLIIPDGVPLSWVLKAKGQSNCERYSGPDLMNDVFKRNPAATHFFLGSSKETLDLIKKKFKGIAAGFYSPPFAPTFSNEEKLKQLKMVKDSGADFIWVGLGAPKQENFVVEMAERASQGVWLAVGAAFDFYAGLKPRAPRILQKAGMEWAFRMATEPRRLARRYMITNPLFIRLALKELLSSKSHDRGSQ